MSYKSFALAATVALALRISVKAQQTGVTTRYWDCCKQSCGWNGKAAVNQAVQSCDSQGNKLTDPNTQSGCDAGASGAFTCADNQPWAINDTYAYGFAAVNIAGESESQWCCECYALTFTSGPVVGQTLIVQTTNTGGDLGANHFDLLIPGGGLGIFTDGCSAQFGSWNGGDQYGGLSNSSQCAGLPASVQAGCEWRFNWFKNADNPNVTFQKTTCPSELVAKSGCLRNDAAPPTTLPPSSGAPPVTNAPPPPPPSSAPAPPSSSSAPSPPASGTAAQWGQCGGTGYSGPTACASPFNCNYVNDYYSQCF